MKELIVRAEYYAGEIIIKEREWSRLRTWLAKHDIELGYEPRKPAPSRKKGARE